MTIFQLFPVLAVPCGVSIAVAMTAIWLPSTTKRVKQLIEAWSGFWTMCYRNPGLAFLLHFSSLLTAQITSQHLTTFTYSHTHSYTDGGACHARCDGPCMSVCAWTCCVVSEVGAGCSGDREDLIVVIGSTWAQCSTGYKRPRVLPAALSLKPWPRLHLLGFVTFCLLYCTTPITPPYTQHRPYTSCGYWILWMPKVNFQGQCTTEAPNRRMLRNVAIMQTSS